MTVSLRLFEPADIPSALEQTRREGWTSCRAWFEIVLAHDPGLCFVASDGGTPVGMITATRFATSAWIGNLIVVPERRRSGLGTLLMEHALGLLSKAGVGTVHLEADPPGMGIYRRLGFVEELESLRFRLPAATAVRPPGVTTLTAGGLADVAAFDRPRYGDDRSRLLRLLFDRAETSVQGLLDERLAGFAMLVEAGEVMHVGPWVAGDQPVAAELLSACLASANGREVRVGIPAPNRAGCDLLRALGCEETAPSMRMVVGECGASGDPTAVYGILNGAVG
jgi:predicted N-acetyltransferase YhbS